MRTLVLAGLLPALLPCAELSAQVCLGFGSLVNSKARIDASAARYTYATARAASVTAGTHLFASAGLGRTHDAEMYASTYDVSVQSGYELSMGSERIAFCPLLTLAVSFGPYDFMLNGDRFIYQEAGVGLALGGIAVQTVRLKVIPTVGVRYSHLAVELIPSDQKLATGSTGWVKTDWYALLSAGLGIVIDDRVTVRPGMTLPLGLVPIRHQSWDDWIVPFGREEGELSLNVTVGISLGRRARPAPQADIRPADP